MFLQRNYFIIQYKFQQYEVEHYYFYSPDGVRDCITGKKSKYLLLSD